MSKGNPYPMLAAVVISSMSGMFQQTYVRNHPLTDERLKKSAEKQRWRAEQIAKGEYYR